MAVDFSKGAAPPMPFGAFNSGPVGAASSGAASSAAAAAAAASAPAGGVSVSGGHAGSDESSGAATTTTTATETAAVTSHAAASSGSSAVAVAAAAASPSSGASGGSEQSGGAATTAATSSPGAGAAASAGSTLTTITTTDSAGAQTAIATQIPQSQSDGDSSLEASSTANAATAHGVGSPSNPTSGARPEWAQDQTADSGGLSKGALAAAIVVPILVAILLVLLAFFLLRRRRRQGRGGYEEANVADNRGGFLAKGVVPHVPTFMVTKKAANRERGYGEGVPSGTSSMARQSVAGASTAAARHPLENIRTNPPPAAVSSNGPSGYTSPSEWYSGASSPSSDPFADAHSGSLSSSAASGSVAWSGFSGPGAGLNTRSTPSERSAQPSRAPSARKASVPMAEAVDDDGVSAVSEASYHDAEVAVASRASPRRASIIHLPGASSPR